MIVEEQYRALCVYLQSCYARGDWHGVSDAANDLRVMDAKHPELAESVPIFHEGKQTIT